MDEQRAKKLEQWNLKKQVWECKKIRPQLKGGLIGLFSGLVRPFKGSLKGSPDHQTTLS